MRSKLIFSITFNFLAILTSVCTPVLFAHIIDSYYLNTSSKAVLSFLMLLAIYVGIWSLSRFFIYLREMTMFSVVERAIHLLAFQLFQHVQLLPFQFHLKRKIGEITSTMEAATQSFPPIVCSIAFNLGPLIIESIGVLSIVGYICGIQYSCVLAMSLAFYIIITRWGFRKALRSLRRANLFHLIATGKIVDSFLNFSSTKYFHTYDVEFQKIDEVLTSREAKVTNALIKDQMIRIYQTMILSFSFLVLMFFTGYDLISNKLTLGEFIMINTYMLQFTTPLEKFGQVIQMLNQCLVKMEKTLKVFKKPIEVQNGTVVLNKEKSFHIIFENVWFGYQKQAPLLKGISFQLLPNQTLAIVGETGSGKSTIVGLLLGLMKPWSGRIIINGYDIKDIDQESLISLIGVVPQEVTLFNDTISHNILYANRTANEKMMAEAIDAASLKETIGKLLYGLETIVGERGTQLSGGEKQRIGLARAIIRQPKLYIFDEATSSVDLKTEKQIVQNIESISHNVSTIIIAHRLSTVAFADRIILLEKGLIKDKSYDVLVQEASVSSS